MKKFWRYWKENFTQAKDGFDKFMLGSGIVASVLTAVCVFFDFPNPVGKFIEDADIKILTSIAAISFFAVWGLIWLPYKRYEDSLAEMELLKNERMSGHDLKIFQAMDKIGDESQINSVCQSMITHRTVDSDRMDILHGLLRYGEKAGNEFMTPSLKRMNNDFQGALGQLVNLAATVFFQLPASRAEATDYYDGPPVVRYALYPDLKEYPPDHEKRKRYEKAHNEVKDAGQEVLATYEAFRREIKRVLFV